MKMFSPRHQYGSKETQMIEAQNYYPQLCGLTRL